MNACLVPRLQNSAGEGNTQKTLSLPVKKVEKSRTVFFGGRREEGLGFVCSRLIQLQLTP